MADPEAPAADATAAPCQFVTFVVDAATFAVPLAEVKEIIRVPTMVDVPLSRRGLAGIANLRGAVLPIASLRALIGLPERAADDQARVVVVGDAAPVGMIVDRVARVIAVEPAEIEPASSLREGMAEDCLAGMIRGDDDVVMILAPERLIERELGSTAPAATATATPTAAAAGGTAAPAPPGDAVTSEVQFVSFTVGGEEYAFPIEEVEEIVQVPGRISRVPGTGQHVVGVMTLRRRLLPLVSLRALFGLPSAAQRDTDRIVVVALGAGSVGIVTDSVKEVLRVPRSLVDTVPAMLDGGGGRRDITAICRLADGARLVSVLAVAALFEGIELSTGGRREAQMADSEARAGGGDEEPFVVFRLGAEEFGVPIAAVKEIVRVPAALTAIPHAPGFVEGVVNLRGAVLPVVDNRRRFGLAPSARSDRQRIMVLTIHGRQTGFIVDQVSEVLKVRPADIGPAPRLGAGADVIARVANLGAAKRMILLVEVDRLVAADGAAAAAA